ncbi:immunoglobulin domain-containing protein [Escherichia coli]|uniref:immunoglobulin domain-containing protein n=1 Tax=Escherichia coli TaxID=562 RepID=UPI0019328BEF|nr:immunoglobulin domain-containing protein [Escherichia coli]MBL7388935.1 immunoglobulin domain-containing protein [Escherichia coli]UWH33480.1 immunoglobulin domain-containing protein [Escherichia coli]UWH38143.1 immunoglobulin domain-containing protein [Escherichia coli]
MQGCANDFGKLIGKVAVLRMAFGCPDAVPALSEWKRLGAMTTKGIDYSMNTINSEADDAKGLVENLVNNMDLTISGEGEFRKSDKDNEIGAWRLSKYIFDEVQAGRQPNLWVRFDFAGENAGTYIQGYMNTTSWSGDFGTNDISTFSGEWKVYDADTVVFEVAPPALAFTTNLPTTKSVAAGSALNMSVAVEGGTAPYTYVWKKDGTVVSGQTTATFNKASAVSGDAGAYTCEVTDSSATPSTITSASCAVTIS